jgi:hypothetical protein
VSPMTLVSSVGAINALPTSLRPHLMFGALQKAAQSSEAISLAAHTRGLQSPDHNLKTCLSPVIVIEDVIQPPSYS